MIFITGDALSPTVQTFLAGTGQPYLEKPFVPAEVRKVVRGHRERRERPGRRPSQHVLDPGEQLAQLEGFGHVVVGTDLRSRRHDRARSRAPSPG